MRIVPCHSDLKDCFQKCFYPGPEDEEFRYCDNISMTLCSTLYMIAEAKKGHWAGYMSEIRRTRASG